MEFIVALLERLYADRAVSLSTAASEVYYQTLQRFHGWIVTGTFTVALKLVPSRWVLAGAARGLGRVNWAAAWMSSVLGGRIVITWSARSCLP